MRMKSRYTSIPLYNYPTNNALLKVSDFIEAWLIDLEIYYPTGLFSQQRNVIYYNRIVSRGDRKLPVFRHPTQFQCLELNMPEFVEFVSFGIINFFESPFIDMLNLKIIDCLQQLIVFKFDWFFQITGNSKILIIFLFKYLILKGDIHLHKYIFFG